MLKQKFLSGLIKTASKKESSAGFTLIELLVVIGIIGLLAGTILLALTSAKGKARDAKRAGDMRQLVTSLEQYYIAHGGYPTGTGSVVSVGTGVLLTDPTAMDLAAEPFVPNFVGMMPTAPGPQDGSCGGDPGLGNNNYWYGVADDGSTYTLTFCLGRATGDWQAGTRTITPNGVQ